MIFPVKLSQLLDESMVMIQEHVGEMSPVERPFADDAVDALFRIRDRLQRLHRGEAIAALPQMRVVGR
jgi:hypothetical protein